MSLNVCIVGAGTMGAGIAQICAQAGWSTVLHDAMPEGLTRGMERIESFWAKGIARGKTSQAEVDAWRPNLRTEGVFEAAVERADLVIEAVPERFELKARIFAALEAHAPSHCILASNTSGISIGRIAQEITTPGRVIGMHFFNPVPIMELLEIVTHDALEETTLATVQGHAKALGKTSIVVRDAPGFATSRLGVVLGNEAIRMLAEGVASASDIDTAMRLGYRHPMGPLELSDLVGLDVRHDILRNLAESYGDDRYLPHPKLVSLVEAGDLGKKTGAGIYDWSEGRAQER